MGASRCVAPRCGHETTGEKLYCINHLEELPYVQEVMGRIARFQEEEWEAVRGVVDLRGLLVQDFRAVVRTECDTTWEKVHGVIRIHLRAFHNVLDALAEAGEVHLNGNRVVWRGESA